MRLVEWLDNMGVDRTGPAPGPGDDEAAEAAALLSEAAGSLGHRLQGVVPAWPLTLSQAMVASLHRCEQLAVLDAASAATEELLSWEAFRGVALDSYVCQVIHSSQVADPVEDLRSIWDAAGRSADIAMLDELLADDATRQERLDDLARLAAGAGAFSACAGLAPQVEVGLAVTLAGTVRLSGRVDVMLGGPGTGSPAALIEVKSTTPRADHGAQLRHYLLLAALVHRTVPAAAAIWYPGGNHGTAAASSESVLEVPVHGAVASSARRSEAALERLGDLWQGRVPIRTAGPHCTWCPEAGECPEAQRAADPFEVAGGR